MRLRAFRNRFLSRTLAAAFAVLVCGGAVDWGHLGGDDRDCDIVVVKQHDHAAHRFSTEPASSSSTDHCYICHSLRLLHQAVTRRSERIAVALRTVHRLDRDVLAVRDGLQVGVASRAPPAGRL
jgi:hypothetical protein